MKEIYENTKFTNFIISPKFLIKLKISETAKIVYVLLLNRARLSQSNHERWTDKEGEVYSHFTIENLAKELGKSESTIKSCLKILREEGIIRTIQRGACKPNWIYVLLPEECIQSSWEKNPGKEEQDDYDKFIDDLLENGDIPF